MGLRKLLRARHRAQAPKREHPLHPLHLQVLFPRPVWLMAADLARMLREVHPSLAHVRVEMRIGVGGSAAGLMEQMALVKWARHTVYVAFMKVPAPPELLEQTLGSGLYENELKAQASTHSAHAILVYQGEERDPLKQYHALAKIAVGLVPAGATVVLNPDACTSYPAARLAPQPGEDLDEVLRTLPLMALFVGFVTLQVEGSDGFWVRTCGAPQLGMPDLALHTDDAHGFQKIYLIFRGIFDAMNSPQVKFKAGDMVSYEELHWKFRAPRTDEGFLHSPRLIVLEPDPTGPRS